MRPAHARGALAALLIGASLIAPRPAPAQAPAAKAGSALTVSLPFEKLTLDNGLEVVLQEDHRSPMVAVNICYHAGSKDDPTARRGLAYLAGALLASPSTRHVDRGHVSEMFRALGVQRIYPGLVRTLDRTHVATVVPTNELELALWLASDSMGFLADGITQKVVDETRDQLEAERRYTETDRPYGAVDRLVRGALYPGAHPYHAPLLGTEEGVVNVSRGDVQSFVKTYFVPNNATLVLAGDIDKARARELVQKYFGPIVRGAAPIARPSPQPTTLEAERRLKIAANVDRPRLQVSWATPAFFAEGDEVLDVLARVLAYNRSGRLFQRLVEGGMADDVRVKQQSHQLGSELEVVVSLKPGRSLDEALSAVDDELGKLRSSGPTAAEIERGRLLLLTQTVLSVDPIASRAGQLNVFAHHTGDPGHLNAYLARYQAVTPADVQRAASQLLPPGRRVVALVSPSKSAPASGKLTEGM